MPQADRVESPVSSPHGRLPRQAATFSQGTPEEAPDTSVDFALALDAAGEVESPWGGHRFSMDEELHTEGNGSHLEDPASVEMARVGDMMVKMTE